MKEPNYTREPIALFRKIKKNKEDEGPSKLLHNLKSAYSEKLKIGAALKTGDCFFDSVAQGLNELKPGHRFTAKSLREDCADYAKQHSWVYKAVIKDTGIGGYHVELEGPYGPIQDPKTKINITDKEKTFNKYLEYITNTNTKTEEPIWGRPGVEGRMICDKYEVELYVYSEDSEKVIVTKITARDDDPEVFIQDVNLDRLKIDNSKKTVGIVNYMQHFVPLLSKISEDIKEDQQVSSEEILGTDKKVPISNQPEQAVRQESSTSAPVLQDHTNKGIPPSHQPEQKENQQVSSEAILGTGKGISPSNQSELPNTGKSNETTVHEVQPDDINQPVSSEAILGTGKGIPTSHQPEQEVRQESSTSAPVYADTVITISHQQEQKTRQEGVQKKLINSYRKEAIYVIATVITAIAFTASAIAAAFTQSIPLAC